MSSGTKNSRVITSAVGARKMERKRMCLETRGKTEFVSRLPPDIYGFANSEVAIVLRQFGDAMRAIRQPGLKMNTVSKKRRRLDDPNRRMRDRRGQAARDAYRFGPHAGAI